MEALEILIGALIFGCLILWVKENKWSTDDTYNFADAARHGTRIKKK